MKTKVFFAAVVVAAVSALPAVAQADTQPNVSTFAGQIFGGYGVSWASGTITVPTAVDFQDPVAPTDDFLASWYMATDGASVTADWTQVGWLWMDGGTPSLYVQYNDPGASNPPMTIIAPVTPGSTISVAVSCNLGTNTWYDWADLGSGLQIVASQVLPMGCGSTNNFWEREVESNAPSGEAGAISCPHPINFSQSLVDVLGDGAWWPALSESAP